MTDPEPSASRSRETAAAIRREHESLRALLARVEAAKDLADLVPLLGELRRELEQHFATEERPDGLHRVIVSREPRYAGVLERILKEHRSLLGELDRILATARRCLDEVEGVVRDAATLAARLHDHEARETELLTDTAYIDLGGGA